jgi:CBS domain-containing protein
VIVKKPASQTLLVEHATEPVQYRVYADTPVSEVVGLMVRRGLHAVPVVGEGYEVLGIITGGDALREILEERAAEERLGQNAEPHQPHSPIRARDVMTRAVLCVSETQPLIDAARTMLNRKVRQLPVVRDGQLIGLITRDAVLEALRPADTQPSDNPDARS